MISALLIMAACSVLYLIKGGQHRKIRLFLEHKAGIEHDAEGHPFSDMSPLQYVVHRLLDGKALSALLFGVLYLIVTAKHTGGMNYVFVDDAFAKYWLAVALWLVAVSPKMGRIVGKIGGWNGNWDENEQPYPSADETDLKMMIEGWKDGLQRGALIGACMVILFWNPMAVFFGLLYPATAWVGTTIEQYRSGVVAAPWVIHEGICGWVCFGCAVVASL